MFNKSDLRDGMVVEFNNGKRKMLWKDRLIDTVGFIWLVNIRDEDLKHVESVDNEIIVKIYETHNIHSINDFFKDECLTLIWSKH